MVVVVNSTHNTGQRDQANDFGQQKLVVFVADFFWLSFEPSSKASAARKMKVLYIKYGHGYVCTFKWQLQAIMEQVRLDQITINKATSLSRSKT